MAFFDRHGNHLTPMPPYNLGKYWFLNIDHIPKEGAYYDLEVAIHKWRREHCPEDIRYWEKVTFSFTDKANAFLCYMAVL